MKGIAIIGLAGRFPGAANIRELWENLQEGRISTGEVPPERWDWRDFYDESGRRTPTKAYTRWGGFLDGLRPLRPPLLQDLARGRRSSWIPNSGSS